MKIRKSNILKVIEHPSALFAGGWEMSMAKFDILVALDLHNKIKFKTFVDVGSASGEYVVAFRRLFPNSIIYPFEPIPEFHRKPSDYKPMQIALWNKNEEIEFMVQKDPRGSKILETKPYSSSHVANEKNVKKIKKVKTARFDSLNLEIERPALLKIDVEGAEKQVLEGFGDKLREFDIIILEYNMVKCIKSSEIIALLEKQGFYSFVQKDLRAGYHQCNLFFIRDGGDDWGNWKFRGEDSPNTAF